jgi:hypothetical protein
MREVVKKEVLKLLHIGIIYWGPGASQWSMDDRSSVMSDGQRVLDWLLA